MKPTTDNKPLLSNNSVTNRGRTLLRDMLAALLVLALSACAMTDRSWAPEQNQQNSAEVSFAKGNFEEAARSWQQQALEASPRQAESLRVRAADAWLLAGQPDEAEDVLHWVDSRQLSAGDISKLKLVLADLALRNSRPDEADRLLQEARANLPSGSRQRYEALYSNVVQQLSAPGSRDISGAIKLINKLPAYHPEAAVDLVRALEGVSSGELAIRAENPRSERQLAGWLDLTLVIRQNLVNPEGVTTAIGDWKIRHPHHLLTEQQALDTWLRYRQLFAPPRRIALLLPETGRLQAVGEAIRDGVLSAYTDNPGGAEILFFGTNDNQQSAISAYFNALDAGVDWIIGPVRKESVEALLSLAGLSTPLLALNDLPADFVPQPGLADQISGISLSQDDEAAAIAAHAARSGYQRALVITPESSWGERMALAFEAEFLQEDRQIIAATRYLESQNDHSATLERLLKIDESKARKRTLENTLQMTLEFEPVRRNDVDVIFLAANANQAKLIRPQLKFFDAGSIPVYATARIYSGQPNPQNDQDLNGVRFPATPWQLGHPTSEDIPELASIRSGSLSSLFALGQDAWNLLTWIDLMQKDPDFSFSGQSGTYRSASSHNFHREPAWAEFRRGRPAPLISPAGLEDR